MPDAVNCYGSHGELQQVLLPCRRHSESQEMKEGDAGILIKSFNNVHVTVAC